MVFVETIQSTDDTRPEFDSCVDGMGPAASQPFSAGRDSPTDLYAQPAIACLQPRNPRHETAAGLVVSQGSYFGDHGWRRDGRRSAAAADRRQLYWDEVIGRAAWGRRA